MPIGRSSSRGRMRLQCVRRRFWKSGGVNKKCVKISVGSVMAVPTGKYLFICEFWGKIVAARRRGDIMYI